MQRPACGAQDEDALPSSRYWLHWQPNRGRCLLDQYSLVKALDSPPKGPRLCLQHRYAIRLEDCHSTHRRVFRSDHGRPNGRVMSVHFSWRVCPLEGVLLPSHRLDHCLGARPPCGCVLALVLLSGSRAPYTSGRHQSVCAWGEAERRPHLRPTMVRPNMEEVPPIMTPVLFMAFEVP